MSQADQAEKLVDRIESNLVIQGQHKFHTEYEHLKDGLQKTADGVFRNARDRLDESTEVRIGAAIAKAKLDGASAPAEYASLVKLAHSVESAQKASLKQAISQEVKSISASELAALKKAEQIAVASSLSTLGSLRSLKTPTIEQRSKIEEGREQAIGHAHRGLRRRSEHEGIPAGLLTVELELKVEEARDRITLPLQSPLIRETGNLCVDERGQDAQPGGDAPTKEFLIVHGNNEGLNRNERRGKPTTHPGTGISGRSVPDAPPLPSSTSRDGGGRGTPARA
jgi:hypothetical protein